MHIYLATIRVSLSVCSYPSEYFACPLLLKSYVPFNWFLCFISTITITSALRNFHYFFFKYAKYDAIPLIFFRSDDSTFILCFLSIWFFKKNFLLMWTLPSNQILFFCFLVFMFIIFKFLFLSYCSFHSCYYNFNCHLIILNFYFKKENFI